MVQALQPAAAAAVAELSAAAEVSASSASAAPVEAYVLPPNRCPWLTSALQAPQQPCVPQALLPPHWELHAPVLSTHV